MKKISIIMMVALTVLFTQCKKAEPITPTNVDGNTRVITVTASLGDGAKTDVDLASGKIKFTGNDMITYAYRSTSAEVYSNYRRYGKIMPANYSGTDKPKLTLSEDRKSVSFEITLTDPESNAVVDFFCADDNPSHKWGHYWDQEETSAQWHTSLLLSKQNGTKDEIGRYHHVMSDSATVQSGNTINVQLKTSIAIARFDLSGFDANENVTVYNTSSRVVLSKLRASNIKYFFDDPIVLENVGGNNNVYVALGEYDGPVTLVFKGATSGKIKCIDFAKILRNTIYTSNDGNSITLTDMSNDFLIGTFSVATDKKVYFAKGNLYYNANERTWRLKDNQYSITSLWSSDDCGHFYWRDDRDSYLYGATEDMVTSLGMIGVDCVDWGRAYNNGNTKITVLTKDEWTYLLNREGKKGFGTVNGVKGIILLPDVFRDPYSDTGSEYNNRFTPNGTHEQNTYNLDGWERMEYAGAVFLPAAGCRYGSDQYCILNKDNIYYWAKDRVLNDGMPYWVYSDGSSIAVEASTTHSDRFYLGACVRLVYVK